MTNPQSTALLSKEEIIKKHCGKLPVPDHAGMVELQTDLSNVEDAMDEWAEIKSRERAIAYSEWIDSNLIFRGSERTWVNAPNDVFPTSDQLYDLFDKLQTENK